MGKLQEALKKEMQTKNQYYEKVGEYKERVFAMETQIQLQKGDIASLMYELEMAHTSSVSVERLEEAESNNTELVSTLEDCRKEIIEHKKINEIQFKQLSLYVEELRRCCGTNIEMKNRIEELIKDKDSLQIAIEGFKESIETLQKEKHDFHEQLQKSLSRENEDKKYIEELKSKITKPDSVAYVYNMKKETVFGMEDIQVS